MIGFLEDMGMVGGGLRFYTVGITCNTYWMVVGLRFYIIGITCNIYWMIEIEN